MEKQYLFQEMVLGQLDSYLQQNEVGPSPHTVHKNQSKWITDPNLRDKTIKPLEENSQIGDYAKETLNYTLLKVDFMVYEFYLNLRSTRAPCRDINLHLHHPR